MRLIYKTGEEVQGNLEGMDAGEEILDECVTIRGTPEYQRAVWQGLTQGLLQGISRRLGKDTLRETLDMVVRDLSVAHGLAPRKPHRKMDFHATVWWLCGALSGFALGILIR